MKNIKKIEINPERLLKKEELKTIQGGYGWTYCTNLQGPCANNPTGNCAEDALYFCDRYCPDWTSIACFDRQ